MTAESMPHAGQAPGERDRRIPSLDGLRAVSIGLVVLAHASGTAGFPPWGRAVLSAVNFGNLGVRVFFVISGYLITTLLLRERTVTGRIDLRRFYLRRFFRIFPAYYAYIAVIACASAAGLVARLPTATIVHALTYTVNYATAGTWITGHFWSLSVEEQFYLLWPVLLAVLGAARGARSAFAFFLAAPFIRLALYQWVPAWHPLIGMSFETVGDTIALGCCLACWREDLWRRRWYRALLSARWLVPTVAIVLAASALIGSRPRLSFLLAMPVVNVGIALVVDWSLRYPTSAVGRLLNTSAVSYVGTLSYSLYIWQEVFLDRHHTSPLLRFPLNLIFAVAAAVASYYVVERPSLRLRARLERRWSSDPNGASDPRGRMSVAA